MTERKRRWWLIPVALLLVVAIVAGVFWDGLAIYLAPKTTLTAALRSTWSCLEERFSGSPLGILAAGVNNSMRKTIALELNTHNDLLGDMAWHMDIHTDGISGNTLAEGTVSTEKNTLDLSVYAGREFAAVSSRSLLQGGYYGITYDTFSEDIRKNQFLAFLIGKDTISQWEESVGDLQESMNQSFAIPELSVSDISMAMVGILTMKAQVDQHTVAVNGENLDYYSISFRAEGEQILSAAQAAKTNLPFRVDESSVLTASFDLYDGKVVRVVLKLTGPDACRLTLTLGQDPSKDDLRLALFLGQGKEYEFGILNTEKTDTRYAEKIYLAHTENNLQDSKTVAYEYTPATGVVSLTCGDRRTEMILTRTEDGFRVETECMEGLLAIFSEEAREGESPAVLTVKEGTEVAAPEYKNFDQWSMDDLMTLLGGAGSLLGLNFG